MPGSTGDKRAQFVRVAARLREKIMSGEWPLGYRLPTEHELAGEHGVSRGTVVRALVMLRDEGLVLTIHGQGSEVAVEPRLTEVRVGPADTATVKLPDDDERDAHGIPQGVPLITVRRPGAAPEHYNGAATVIRGA